MATCHAHNLRDPDSGLPRPYGVRVSLRPGDPFRTLLGADWSRTHWFETPAERDAALADLSRKHVGRPMPNVPLLGGFAAVSGVIGNPW